MSSLSNEMDGGGGASISEYSPAPSETNVEMSMSQMNMGNQHRQQLPSRERSISELSSYTAISTPFNLEESGTESCETATSAISLLDLNEAELTVRLIDIIEAVVVSEDNDGALSSNNDGSISGSFTDVTAASERTSSCIATDVTLESEASGGISGNTVINETTFETTLSDGGEVTDSELDSDDTTYSVTRAQWGEEQLNEIEDALEVAHGENAFNQISGRDVNEEDAASSLVRTVRYIVRLPFNILYSTIVGVYRFNMMLIKVPLIPFYLLKNIFYGIANMMTPKIEPPPQQSPNGNGEEVAAEATSNDRQTAGSDTAVMESDEYITDLNDYSEYNESSCPLSEFTPIPSQTSVFVADSAIQPTSSSFDEAFGSNGSLNHFLNAPSRVLESPEREGCDTPAPPPLYSSTNHQGFENDFDYGANK